MENLPLPPKESMGYVDALVDFGLYTANEESLGRSRNCFFVCLCRALRRSGISTLFFPRHRRLHSLYLGSHHCRGHHPLHLTSGLCSWLQEAWSELDRINRLRWSIFDSHGNFTGR